ncbi:MAG TPA: SDR family oxidoreductase [Caulobacteraceae bacterium]|jgi:nucleoside-diphosphate-sugar epimerase|nr:SDR family oxidoreductase [Caulobacteraceae bacterium]
MRVFVTGATGFIGAAIIPELLAAGHQVLGLTRSQAGAEALVAAGAAPHHGALEDLESLEAGAAQSDGVIHCAFIHDFSKFVENSKTDRLAIEALGAVLAGSDRPLIVSSGIGPWTPGRPVTEDVDHPAQSSTPRVSEPTAFALRDKGVSAAVVRLPQVHDVTKQGLVSPLIGIAREKGVSAYVGDGLNRWPAAHVSDVGRLYALALDGHTAGARWHAVGEEGVSLRDVAEAIGRGLGIPVVSLAPEQAGAHFGFFGGFVGADLSASSALTQQRLGWRPTGPGMVADLDAMRWSDA